MKIPFKKQKPIGRQPLAQTGRPKTAFSYYAGDTPQKKDSVRARQASEQRLTFFKKLRLVPTIIALSVIFLSIVYSTTLSTTPGVIFAGDTSPYRTIDAYKAGIKDALQESVLNKSKLTISTAKIESDLLKAFPELDVATVSLPVIGRRPTVTIHARVSALILTTSSNAYVLDTAGKVIAEASQLISSAKDGLVTVQDQSGLVVKLGKQALTYDAVSFIANAKAQLVAKQVVISQMTLPAVPNEVDIRIKDQPYYIKADMSGDARLQMGAYLAAKESGVAPAEYMDVRVEEKVFYK